MKFGQLKRREFITSRFSAARRLGRAPRAQQPAMPVVGFFNSASSQGYALT
jgi:hypothetical protein